VIDGLILEGLSTHEGGNDLLDLQEIGICDASLRTLDVQANAHTGSELHRFENVVKR